MCWGIESFAGDLLRASKYTGTRYQVYSYSSGIILAHTIHMQFPFNLGEGEDTRTHAPSTSVQAVKAGITSDNGSVPSVIEQTINHQDVPFTYGPPGIISNDVFNQNLQSNTGTFLVIHPCS